MQKIELLSQHKVNIFAPTWDVLPPAQTLREALALGLLEVVRYTLWRLARWVGVINKGHSCETKQVHKIVTIDFDNIVDSTWEHIIDVHERTGKTPKILLIGDRTFFDFRREIFTKFPHDFVSQTTNPSMNWRGFNWRGLKIVVVPWMDGFVALTDEELLSGDRS